GRDQQNHAQPLMSLITGGLLTEPVSCAQQHRMHGRPPESCDRAARGQPDQCLPHQLRSACGARSVVVDVSVLGVVLFVGMLSGGVVCCCVMSVADDAGASGGGTALSCGAGLAGSVCVAGVVLASDGSCVLCAYEKPMAQTKARAAAAVGRCLFMRGSPWH